MYTTFVLWCLVATAFAKPTELHEVPDQAASKLPSRPELTELQEFIQPEEELTRRKKNTITTFCVEIRPSHQEPFKVCNPVAQAGDKGGYNNQNAAPYYPVQNYGAPEQLKPQEAAHSGSENHAKPAYSAPVKTYTGEPSKNSYGNYRSTDTENEPMEIEQPVPARAAFPSETDAVSDPIKQEDEKLKSEEATEGPAPAATTTEPEPTPMVKTDEIKTDQPEGSANEEEDGEDQKKYPSNMRTAYQQDGYHNGAGYGDSASYIPVSPALHHHPKPHHSGLVITCQPNLAGYAHGVPGAYHHGGAAGGVPGGYHHGAAGGGMSGGYHHGGAGDGVSGGYHHGGAGGGVPNYNYRTATGGYGRPYQYRPQLQQYGGYKPYQARPVYSPQPHLYNAQAYPMYSHPAKPQLPHLPHKSIGPGPLPLPQQEYKPQYAPEYAQKPIEVLQPVHQEYKPQIVPELIHKPVEPLPAPQQEFKGPQYGGEYSQPGPAAAYQASQEYYAAPAAPPVPSAGVAPSAQKPYLPTFKPTTYMEYNSPETYNPPQTYARSEMDQKEAEPLEMSEKEQHTLRKMEEISNQRVSESWTPEGMEEVTSDVEARDAVDDFKKTAYPIVTKVVKPGSAPRDYADQQHGKLKNAEEESVPGFNRGGWREAGEAERSNNEEAGWKEIESGKFVGAAAGGWREAGETGSGTATGGLAGETVPSMNGGFDNKEEENKMGMSENKPEDNMVEGR